MKQFFMALLCLCGLYSPLVAQGRLQDWLRLDVQNPVELPHIDWSKAGEHIGEIVEVQGTVVRTHDSGKATFLNFSENWKGTFSAVIFSATVCDFPVAPVDFFLGREVQVRGKIQQYKGAPEIIIESTEQISVVDGTQMASKPVLIPHSEAPVATQSAAPSLVRIMSWNLENFFDRYDDPYSQDQKTHPSFVTQPRQQRIADAIHLLNPDVLCVEEVENRALLEEFNRSFLQDMGYEVILVEGNDRRGIDVGMLSRLPIRAVTSYRHLRFQDAQAKEQHFRRDLLRVSLGGNFDADIYVVHLKSQIGGDSADIARTAEAHAAATILAAEMEKNTSYRALICGDFNEVRENPTVQEFLQVGLVDACAGTEKVSYHKKPHRSRIDFALFTPSLSKQIQSAVIVDQLLGVDLDCCSDHYPVLVELKLP